MEEGGRGGGVSLQPYLAGIVLRRTTQFERARCAPAGLGSVNLATDMESPPFTCTRQMMSHIKEGKQA